MTRLHFDILDQKRQQLLSSFAPLQTTFYLAGETGLALQLGHRDSIDFDFFCHDPFSTIELERKIQSLELFQTIKKFKKKKTRSLCLSTK